MKKKEIHESKKSDEHLDIDNEDKKKDNNSKNEPLIVKIKLE